MPRYLGNVGKEGEAKGPVQLDTVVQEHVLWETSTLLLYITALHPSLIPTLSLCHCLSVCLLVRLCLSVCLSVSLSIFFKVFHTQVQPMLNYDA